MRVAVMLIITSTLSVGCQAMKYTEKYCDCIDGINDSYPTPIDDCYHVELDLQRIGRRDWCASDYTGWCRRACRVHPPYPIEVRKRPSYSTQGAIPTPAPGEPGRLTPDNAYEESVNPDLELTVPPPPAPGVDPE